MMAGCRDPNMVQLARFLYLGDEQKLYPESVQFPFAMEKVKSILETKETTSDAVQEILRAFREGHYLGLETLIYALALCAHSSNEIGKREAFEAASEVCASASSMFSFVHFYKQISQPTSGWGSAHRRFLSNWYNARDASDLAIEITKVKSRHKWTHKDVLCMSHVKAKMPGTAAVLKSIIKGIENAEKDYGHLAEVQPVLGFLKGAKELSHTSEPETAAKLIEVHKLCLEHVPSKLLKFQEVSLCLILRMPICKLLELLPLFNRHGLLKPNSAHLKAVLERLSLEDTLRDGNIDPLQSFLAIRRWQSANKIILGRPRPQTKDLDDVLQNLHDSSFKSVVSKEKKYLIALDINIGMNLHRCAGCNVMTPSHVSDIILMALIKAELSDVTVVVFSDTELVSVDINNKMTLPNIVEHLSQVKSGPVQLSAPVIWALQRKTNYDCFLVFSDLFKCPPEDDYAASFREYKDTLHLPDSRYILCTFCDRKSSFVTDKSDMLNIIGFNIHLLKIIQDFTSGVF